MWWLLREDKAQALSALRKAVNAPTAEQFAEFRQRAQAARDSGPRSLRIAGDTAAIHIEGVLTKELDLWLEWIGEPNTAYRDVIAAIDAAHADPAVKKIELIVDSPGGHVDGLFDCLAALQASTKPITKSICAEACSAAYSLASQAKEIEATSVAAVFGSIGVAQSFYVFDFIVTVTSTEAPEKRPDVTTDEGKAQVRKYLDQVHDLYVGAIASGRKVSAAHVNAEYGRGGVVLGEEAKKRGMIDSVAKPKARSGSNTRAASDGAPQECNVMTLDKKKLKAENPDLYAELLAEGEAAGVKKERDRVGAHLELGKTAGAIETAIEAVLAGTEMTQTMTAKYLAAGMNRNAQTARQTDDAQTQQVVQGATTAPATATKDVGDAIVELLDKNKKKVG